ncbi:FAD-dependent oxidoreductase [Phanerochaete sordida]|uniref:FAD-dependent oxidoreductase n=1 Tax=Phanerochaete sordida TaxID=48140 RepID=A0A9P3G2T7_9APHY|nr:FAD-dependent oxidoreductase [Phanerochaete sordida]
MRELGAYDDILAHTAEPGRPNIRGFRYVFGAEGHREIFTMPLTPAEYGASVHRTAFLDALTAHVDPACVHLGKRCVYVAAGPGARHTLRFADGSSAQADVVLLANGMKCAQRGLVTGAPPGAAVSFGDTLCYRGLVTREGAAARGVDTSFWSYPMVCLGHGKHIVIYPIQKGAVINIAAFTATYDVPIGHPSTKHDAALPSLEVVDTAELLAAFADYGSNIRAVLGCIAKPNRWRINTVYPHLPTYARGRVALLGDAAHAMLPHLYAGAGQGIEDAYLLAQLLSHAQTTPANVEDVLKVYDELRRPRSQRVWDESTEAGKIRDGCGPSGFTIEGIRKDLTGALDYVNSYKLGEDVLQAELMLKQRGVYA